MRIIGGRFRGRRIEAPKGTDTRPTTDRVRESLASALTSRLGSDLAESRILDPFAGSGALGLECLSRGAIHATFVEQGAEAFSTLRGNIGELGVGASATVLRGNAFALAKRGALPGPYSLIMLDPPYTLDQNDVTALLLDLSRVGAIDQEAVVSWEHQQGHCVTWPEGFVADGTKRYGSTEIEFAVFRGETPES